MNTQIFIYDLSCNGLSICENITLPFFIRQRFEHYKNQKAHDLSYCAYSLLYRVFSRLGLMEDSFVVGEKGKPDFKSSHFSISHSGEMVCLLISSSPCGVDIQSVSEMKDYTLLAKRLLSEKDYQNFENSEDPAMFFVSRWTSYEASIKREGTGISSEIVLSDPDLKRQKIVCDSLGNRYCLSYCADEEASFVEVNG